MKKELDRLTEHMVMEMNGKTNNVGSQIECPFSCNFVREPLLEHLNKKHSKDIAFVCSECEEPIPGGIKKFIVHQISYHPRLTPSYLMDSVIHYKGDPIEHQEMRYLNFKGICPYCKIPMQICNENALKEHLESLHENMLESGVNSVVKSVKFVTAEEMFEATEGEKAASFLSKASKSYVDTQQASSTEDLSKITGGPSHEVPQVGKEVESESGVPTEEGKLPD